MRLGERLADRFEIEQQIGTGGMGEVFRARDPITGEVVAVKVIAGGRAARSARFTREVEMLAALSHPGVVRYISHGETASGELYLIVEWLEGEDLVAAAGARAADGGGVSAAGAARGGGAGRGARARDRPPRSEAAQPVPAGQPTSRR